MYFFDVCIYYLLFMFLIWIFLNVKKTFISLSWDLRFEVNMCEKITFFLFKLISLPVLLHF